MEPTKYSYDVPGGLVYVDKYDLRGEAGDALPKSKVVNGVTVRRDPASVTGIVLHQTGAFYGVSAAQLRASGGDRYLAKARRFKNVPAHAVASTDGFFVVHCELEHYMNHAHTLNRDTLGLEVEGNYGATKGRGDQPTELTIDAARAALHYLVTEGRSAGMPIEYIYGHIQSYAKKPSDPGEVLWREVALWGVEHLGLKSRPTFTRGEGAVIPKGWYS